VPPLQKIFLVTRRKSTIGPSLKKNFRRPWAWTNAVATIAFVICIWSGWYRIQIRWVTCSNSL